MTEIKQIVSTYAYWVDFLWILGWVQFAIFKNFTPKTTIDPARYLWRSGIWAPLYGTVSLIVIGLMGGLATSAWILLSIVFLCPTFMLFQAVKNRNDGEFVAWCVLCLLALVPISCLRFVQSHDVARIYMQVGRALVGELFLVFWWFQIPSEKVAQRRTMGLLALFLVVLFAVNAANNFDIVAALIGN